MLAGWSADLIENRGRGKKAEQQAAIGRFGKLVVKSVMSTSFKMVDCGYGEQCPMLASRSADLMEMRLVIE